MSFACPFELPIGNKRTFLITECTSQLPVLDSPSWTGSSLLKEQRVTVRVPFVTSTRKLRTQGLLVHLAIIFQRPSEYSVVLCFLAHIGQVFGSEGIV